LVITGVEVHGSGVKDGDLMGSPKEEENMDEDHRGVGIPMVGMASSIACRRDAEDWPS
jgi:hypothetical protein